MQLMTTIEPGKTFKLDGAAIANFVKLQRLLFGWKQDMLASMAGVSLATVQRVERGIKVRPAQLRKIAKALRQPEDEFLRERIRPTPEQAAANFVGMFDWAEGRMPVEVAPLRTEQQLRAIVMTEALLLVDDLESDAAGAVDELREWLGLASFIQAERHGLIAPGPDRNYRVRQLWRNILQCVERIEQLHCAVVLAGTYEAGVIDGEGVVPIAIIAVRSRRSNPAAGKIRQLWADAKVDQRQMLADYFAGLD
jgi:transcriptional regulator with XRE-family HTH domain